MGNNQSSRKKAFYLLLTNTFYFSVGRQFWHLKLPASPEGWGFTQK
jgi:hypothetical protein